MALLFEKEEADIFREGNCEVWVPAAFDSFGVSTTSPLGVPMRQPLGSFRTGSSRAASIRTGWPIVAWLVRSSENSHDPRVDPQDAILAPPKLILRDTLLERSKKNLQAFKPCETK